MSLAHSPSIIMDGLWTYVDAANPRSYPGSGTTWYDLGPRNKNGTLLNGPGWVSDNGGAFQFDGVNQVVNFSTMNAFMEPPMAEWTVEVVFKSLGTTPTTGTQPFIWGFSYGWRLGVNTLGIYTGLDNGTTTIYRTLDSSKEYKDSEWHYVGWSNNGTESKINIDGRVTDTWASGWIGQTRWPSNSMLLGRDLNNSMYFFRGYIAMFRMYNTALSHSQINSNLGSVRGRYGI